ncbi:hypothetical protein BC829DRAFT_418082 [Chytridium lagenaria]|nr:hypothetical protein BC829DRAFT_418082 [Chytridium lagenaria]
MSSHSGSFDGPDIEFVQMIYNGLRLPPTPPKVAPTPTSIIDLLKRIHTSVDAFASNTNTITSLLNKKLYTMTNTLDTENTTTSLLHKKLAIMTNTLNHCISLTTLPTTPSPILVVIETLKTHFLDITSTIYELETTSPDLEDHRVQFTQEFEKSIYAMMLTLTDVGDNPTTRSPEPESIATGRSEAGLKSTATPMENPISLTFDLPTEPPTVAPAHAPSLHVSSSTIPNTNFLTPNFDDIPSRSVSPPYDNVYHDPPIETYTVTPSNSPSPVPSPVLSGQITPLGAFVEFPEVMTLTYADFGVVVDGMERMKLDEEGVGQLVSAIVDDLEKDVASLKHLRSKSMEDVGGKFVKKVKTRKGKVVEVTEVRRSARLMEKEAKKNRERV